MRQEDFGKQEVGQRFGQRKRRQRYTFVQLRMLRMISGCGQHAAKARLHHSPSLNPSPEARTRQLLSRLPRLPFTSAVRSGGDRFSPQAMNASLVASKFRLVSQAHTYKPLLILMYTRKEDGYAMTNCSVMRATSNLASMLFVKESLSSVLMLFPLRAAKRRKAVTIGYLYSQLITEGVL